MQPAKKFGGNSDIASHDQFDAQRVGQDGVWPASSAAGAAQWHGGDGAASRSEPVDRQAVTAAASDETAINGDEPLGPVGARARQAILEQAFAEQPQDGAPAMLDRAELQGARDAAAQWSNRSGLPAYFWERLARDVSIFTIVFAALVLVILQAM